MAVLDVANAFLHMHNDERVFIIPRGKLAETMMKRETSMYREYITYSNNGVPMLYVRLSRALYSMLRDSLLFYKCLISNLEDRGFVVNPYDPCVANTMVDGVQMNMCWHVDDLKIYHMDEDMVTAFTVEMANIYGTKTTISRVRVHDYLGMELDSVTRPV